jgi:hypothetical protein
VTDHVATWTGPITGPAEPTILPVLVEPSPEGADDTARLLGVAIFNGLCRVITALADRALLSRDELLGIEDAMTTPLDDPEWRDDEVIQSFRDIATEVIARAAAAVEGAH